MTDVATPVRAIYVSGVGKWVSIGAYVKQIKLVKANPDAEFKNGLTMWGPHTGHQIMRQFRRGMHDRITQGIPHSLRGVTP